MNTNFFSGKTVLITGHTGFKGSWLSLSLQTKGATVIGYSLPPSTRPNLFESIQVGDGMVSITGDIRDLAHLNRTMREHQPDIVIHLAAQALVRASYSDPVETYTTNVMGTVNVLEAARHSDTAKVVLIITTDKCYENKEWVWGYRENDALGGYDPYSSSKACAELVTSAYTTAFFSSSAIVDRGVAIASARAGNVIGGGDWAEDRLLPDIIRAIIDKKTVRIRNPNAVRPWQHVLEPLSGYMRLIEKLWSKGSQFSGGWNFGPNIDSCVPVAFILERVKKLWGDVCQWENSGGDALHEANFLKLDCTKALTLLSWSPKLDLDQSLRLTMDWYDQYIRGDDVRRVTEQQITLFEKMEH